MATKKQKKTKAPQEQKPAQPSPARPAEPSAVKDRPGPTMQTVSHEEEGPPRR